jgi:hypothetical protein
MLDVAQEQRRDRLKEAETARLLQSKAGCQAEVEAQPRFNFNHILGMAGWHLKKYPGRI